MLGWLHSIKLPPWRYTVKKLRQKNSHCNVIIAEEPLDILLKYLGIFHLFWSVKIANVLPARIYWTFEMNKNKREFTFRCLTLLSVFHQRRNRWNPQITFSDRQILTARAAAFIRSNNPPWVSRAVKRRGRSLKLKLVGSRACSVYSVCITGINSGCFIERKTH